MSETENKKPWYKLFWLRLKWLVVELVKIYSHKPSFFSKKRIESGIAFCVLQWGAIYWLLTKASSMTTTDFLLWGAAEAAICGYAINQIQKEKILEKANEGTV